MSAKIHIERMMYRGSIAVAGESAASYALVKLIPSAEGGSEPLGLTPMIIIRDSSRCSMANGMTL